jgi:hypothetical protein
MFYPFRVKLSGARRKLYAIKAVIAPLTGPLLVPITGLVCFRSAVALSLVGRLAGHWKVRRLSGEPWTFCGIRLLPAPNVNLTYLAHRDNFHNTLWRHDTLCHRSAAVTGRHHCQHGPYGASSSVGAEP